MKYLLSLSLLLLSACTSFNRHEEVVRIYNEFEQSAKGHAVTIDPYFKFEYLVVPIPMVGTDKPLAACAPQHPKSYYQNGGDEKWQKYWNSLPSEEQDRIVSFNKIVFLDTSWESLSKEKREIVLFHELGHCAFNLPHAQEPCRNKIMCDRISNIITSDYATHKQKYLNDLFSSYLMNP